MDERLRVNPILCTGHGLCAELIPERIQLDEWGYPIISDEPISPRLSRYASRAVADCPALALFIITKKEVRAGPSRVARRRS